MRRRGWVAGLLSFVTPGLGQLYAGAPWQGLACFVAIVLLSYVLAFALTAIVGAWVLFAVILLAIGVHLGVIAHAVLTARRARPGYTLRPFNRWYLYVALWAGHWLVMSPIQLDRIRSTTVEAFSVPTASMAPAVLPGDLILVDKRGFATGGRAVERDDIVIVAWPEVSSAPIMTRVTGVPGDVIGGAPLPEDRYFVEADVPGLGADSNNFGPIPRSAIVGRLAQIYWSWDRERGAVRWDRMGSRP